MEKKKRLHDIRLSGRLQLKGVWLFTTLVAFFVIPFIFRASARPNISILANLKSPVEGRVHYQMVEEEIKDTTNIAERDTDNSLNKVEEIHDPERNDIIHIDTPISDTNNSSSQIEEIQEISVPDTAFSDTNDSETKTQNIDLVSVPFVFKNVQIEENTKVENQYSQDNGDIQCDFTQERYDSCVLHGDVRVSGRHATITVASQSEVPQVKIRPYSRKWEQELMARIREFTVTTSQEKPPKCDVNHTAPAVIFSTGGHVGNFFHDFTDVLVPLFATSRMYNTEVHFLVSDFSIGWVTKFQPILSRLSKYNIINIDDQETTHCFPKVQLGLISHKELGIDSSKTPNNVSMNDFRAFLRSTFSLPRKSVGKITNRKPRLLIILRKGSRAFSNPKQVVSMGKRAGFKVVTAGTEEVKDLAKFARIVNSCDIMMGVHGAGLTNMVFLPEGGSVIQILPWGGLHYACYYAFGAPAVDMGLGYYEYDVKETESSLVKRYSRDDVVFKDPLKIHEGGFGAIWSVFLRDQTVKLDVKRFRGVLGEALQYVVHDS